MRAAIFRNGEIVVDQMPDPEPGAGMVLVKSLACGICGSDLHARKHAHRMVDLAKFLPGRKPMDLSRDVVFGHEFCCEILDYGPGPEPQFKPGTQASAAPAVFEREYRPLCRTHGAEGAAAARSSQRAQARTCGADRTIGRRHSRR